MTMITVPGGRGASGSEVCGVWHSFDVASFPFARVDSYCLYSLYGVAVLATNSARRLSSPNSLLPPPSVDITTQRYTPASPTAPLHAAGD